VFDDGQDRLTDFAGGLADSHWQWGATPLDLGVLLEDLKCEGESWTNLLLHVTLR
jgi:hypothetical protein